MTGSHRAGTRPVSGIVLVDKPAGVTSNRILQKTRRLFQARKAGHTGTLDPPATGMLPVCLGAATRVSGLMLDASKRYRVTAEFGVATDTGDASGAVLEERETAAIALESVLAALSKFQGRSQQIPPMYSALKHKGRRLYELARAGQSVERAPRQIEVFELAVESLEWPRLVFDVRCSKGTYVRTLVGDLGAELGTVAHVQALRRTGVGPFGEAQMVSMDSLEHAASEGLEQLDRFLLPIDAALQDWPAVTVDAANALALRQGRAVPTTAEACGAPVRIYDPFGTLVGLGEVSGAGELRPSCIFPESTLG